MVGTEGVRGREMRGRRKRCLLMLSEMRKDGEGRNEVGGLT